MFLLKMVIFHSYVSLPEGKVEVLYQIVGHILGGDSLQLRPYIGLNSINENDPSIGTSHSYVLIVASAIISIDNIAMALWHINHVG